MADPRARPKELDRRLRARNWAIFAVLAGLALVFYLMTIVRMGGAVR